MTNTTPDNIEDKVLDFYNYYDKACCVKRIENDILKKTLRFFKYSGLPTSMPERNIELILQREAFGIIPTEGDIVMLRGGFAPPHNVYQESTKVIVNNPYGLIVPGKPLPQEGTDVHLNKTFTIGEDCVLVRNDPLYEGMLPFIWKYGVFITEAELTLLNILFSARAQYAFAVDDDKGYQSALAWIDGLRQGKQGAIQSKNFGEGISTQPYSNIGAGTITQMIEAIQFFDAKLNNGVGLDMNFNMKRERLNDGEVDLNTNSVKTILNTFIEERQEGFNALNKVRGTEITVELRKEETKELFGNQYPGVDLEEEETTDDTPEMTQEEGSEEVVEETTEETVEEPTEVENEPTEDKVETITEEIADKVLDKLIEALDNNPDKSDNEENVEEPKEDKEDEDEDDKRDNA